MAPCAHPSQPWESRKSMTWLWPRTTPACKGVRAMASVAAPRPVRFGAVVSLEPLLHRLVSAPALTRNSATVCVGRRRVVGVSVE